LASLLIIGGSGFFGKSILDAYQRGLLNLWEINSIIVLARNAEKLKKTHSNLIDPTIKLIDDDIGKCECLPEADYVIHAAASTDATSYLERPLDEKLNILSGSLNYCRLAKIYHKNSKILFVSSGAVYGLQPSDIPSIPESYSLSTDVDQLPANKRDYAAAKRDSEQAFIKLGNDGLQVSVARCFAFVGPYLPLDKHFAIGNFIGDGLAKRDILVKAKNLVYRSYMYSDDLVNWLMNILISSNTSCPIYNVGSSEEISIIELAECVAKIFEVEAVYETPHKNQNLDRYIPDISKARNDLCLEIKTQVEEAIIKTRMALITNGH
jgi:nucleoside-diphosphate-sugar epimerase